MLIAIFSQRAGGYYQRRICHADHTPADYLPPYALRATTAGGKIRYAGVSPPPVYYSAKTTAHQGPW
jgi:hypothetical protein